MKLRPSEIRFTQDSIYHQMWGRIDVNGTIDKITAGKQDVKSIPKIDVAERDGKYYSLDNRRLYIFRVLEKMGKLNYIDVNITCSWSSRKFTTNNDGYSVRMKGGCVRPHTFDSLLPPPIPKEKVGILESIQFRFQETMEKKEVSETVEDTRALAAEILGETLLNITKEKMTANQFGFLEEDVKASTEEQHTPDANIDENETSTEFNDACRENEAETNENGNFLVKDAKDDAASSDDEDLLKSVPKQCDSERFGVENQTENKEVGALKEGYADKQQDVPKNLQQIASQYDKEGNILDEAGDRGIYDVQIVEPLQNTGQGDEARSSCDSDTGDDGPQTKRLRLDSDI